MSTIEKAAARLVKKKIQPAKPDSVVSEKAEATSVSDNTVDNLVEVPIAIEAGAIESKIDSTDSNLDHASDPPLDAESNPAGAAPSVADSEYRNSCELDFPWLAENGFLVPNHQNHRQSQEFRRIKRPLLQNLRPHISQAQERPTNLIYITSALPSEGKTFVSLNLALSLAGEVDRSVLLIDGDVAKGDLSRWMGIYEEPGLVDLLSAGSTSADSSIIETNVDRLSVLPCGKSQDNLDELYASDLMRRVIDDLANSVAERIIVIDGPPLIPTTEASVLAGLMGQTVLVVEANQTPQAAVEQAVVQLENAQLVSALLNKVPESQSSDYGYGYGYGKDGPRYSRSGAAAHSETS